MLSAIWGQTANAQTGRPSDLYQTRIAPIFETRCVACHSCYNAPCQFNAQSYAGADRGAASTNIYDATRLQSVAPTRLGVDADSTADWRAKGFFDVLAAGKPEESLLLRLLRMRQQHAGVQPAKQVAQSQTCPTQFNDPRLAEPQAVTIGMPYGLPPLPAEDIAALEAWVAEGAPGPEAGVAARDTSRSNEIAAWEIFLNEPGQRERLVSRYLYEHLFLAHLYFGDGAGKRGERPQFFRLVRSRTACGEGINEVATRRPTDEPDAPVWFYCLKPFDAAIVEKTHIPYELSPQKLARIRQLFFGESWAYSAPEAPQSDGGPPTPFERYAAIPVRARYQFLLDDAHYHIATFIKGPVCNGSSAVNSIQEQFFVFFLKPEADSMVMLPDFAKVADRFLRLPGAYGSDIGVLSDVERLPQIVEYRERYRDLRAESVTQLRPQGYALSDIWDGDGTNPNALLTVFRHFDNAAVVKGAVGDLSKTVFVLDYSLFERLVYNLVVEFDVFGNVGHQFLTRIYMDLIRMEAEELFLSFLPREDRVKLRNSWYVGGLLTDIKMRVVFPFTNADQPTAVAFKTKNAKREFVERALFERLPAAVRGRPDSVNWRQIGDPRQPVRRTPVETALRAMAGIPAVDATPFARFFPELSYLVVQREGGSDLYSIVHNRELENVSWIMGEELRLAPKEDTLTIANGVLGAYPGLLFRVAERDLGAFSQQAAAIKDERAFEAFVDRFGVRRTSPDFWTAYDQVNQLAQGPDPVHRGILDLTRYAIEGAAARSSSVRE